MAIYTVTLSARAVVTRQIEVEADTPEAAKSEAEGIARLDDSNSWDFAAFVHDDAQIKADSCEDENGNDV